MKLGGWCKYLSSDVRRHLLLLDEAATASSQAKSRPDPKIKAAPLVELHYFLQQGAVGLQHSAPGLQQSAAWANAPRAMTNSSPNMVMSLLMVFLL